MTVAHITAPKFQLQPSSSKKSDAAWIHEMTDCNEISEIFDADTPAPEKSACLVLVTVSDEELDDVMLVFDSHYDKKNHAGLIEQTIAFRVPTRKSRHKNFVIVLGDVFIDCNKMDDQKDCEAVVAATAQNTSTNCHTR